MSLSEIQAAYRSGFQGADVVTLRRYAGRDQNRTHFDFQSVRARVTGYAAADLVGDIEQGDRLAIVLAEDVYRVGFPIPIRKGDGMIVAGAICSIEAVDDNTRRVGGNLMAYEIRIRG